MSNIQRTEKSKEIEDLRAAIEHRAIWFYYLIDEANKRGIALEFARDAMTRCGCFHGFHKFPRTDNLPEFINAFANANVREIFEMEVETDEDISHIHFHYCPLVNAWKKLGCDAPLIKEMCDVAMDGDRGIISTYDHFSFELGDTIAAGSDTCEVTFRKK